ncbi:MAG: GIY-YIG nuclease family protein [Bacilli bacterium]
MSDYYVYIILCADGSLYTGYSVDVKKRFLKHCDGVGAKYTRGRQPLELVYVEKFETKSCALKREYVIKKLSKVQKLKLISAYKKTAYEAD